MFPSLSLVFALFCKPTDYVYFLELVSLEEVYYFVHLVYWMLCYYSFRPGKCTWLLRPS